MQAERTFLFWN